MFSNRDRELVRRHCAAICDHHDFRAPRRLRKALSHLVERTLEGKASALTQRQLARDIFSRDAAFDPGSDAIVRVEMGKLRRYLEAFYSEHDDDFPVTIEIARGSYVPAFSFRQSPGAGTGKTAGRDGFAIDIYIEPFTYHGSNADRRWIADTLREELTLRLGRLPCLRVPGGAGTRDWPRQQRVPAAAVRNGLPRFRLGGSVTCFGTRVRVLARLHDMDSDRQVWAHRYDRALESGDLFEVQEAIANEVIAASLDPFTGKIGERLRRGWGVADDPRRPDMELGAYRALVQYIRYQHQMTDAAYQSARQALEVAHISDPADPMVLSMLGDLRRAGHTFCFSSESACLEEITDWHRGLAHDQREQPWYRVSLGFSLLVAGELDEARDNAYALLQDRMAPSSSKADAALQLALAGDWEEGSRRLTTYLSGLGEYPAYLDYVHCLANYRHGDYAGAWKRSRTLRANGLFWGPMMQAASLGKLGCEAESRPAILRLLSLRPDFPHRANHYLSMFVAEPRLRHDLVEGLRRCGLRVSG